MVKMVPRMGRAVRKHPVAVACGVFVLLAGVALTITAAILLSNEQSSASLSAAKDNVAQSSRLLSAQLELALAPLHVTAVAIAISPAWSAVAASFETWVSQVVKKMDTSMLLRMAVAPAGKLASSPSWPAAQEPVLLAREVDIISATPAQQDPLESIIEKQSLIQVQAMIDPNYAPTRQGPLLGLVGVTMPVFLPNATADGLQSLGLPTPVNPSCSNPGACYNPESRELFWGWLHGEYDLHALWDITATSTLGPLQHHNYRIIHTTIHHNGSIAWQRVLSSSQHAPNGKDVQKVSIDVLGSNHTLWTLEVQPRNNAGRATLAIILAVGLTASVLLAALSLLVLLERAQYKELVEALVPTAVARKLMDSHAEGAVGSAGAKEGKGVGGLLGLGGARTSGGGRASLRASGMMDTPAARLLAMLNAMLVEGAEPSVQDIVYARTALMEGWDIHKPLMDDLAADLRAAPYADDVADALMHQLGLGAGHVGVGMNMAGLPLSMGGAAHARSQQIASAKAMARLAHGRSGTPGEGIGDGPLVPAGGMPGILEEGAGAGQGGQGGGGGAHTRGGSMMLTTRSDDDDACATLQGALAALMASTQASFLFDETSDADMLVNTTGLSELGESSYKDILGSPGGGPAHSGTGTGGTRPRLPALTALAASMRSLSGSSAGGAGGSGASRTIDGSVAHAPRSAGGGGHRERRSSMGPGVPGAKQQGSAEQQGSGLIRTVGGKMSSLFERASMILDKASFTDKNLERVVERAGMGPGAGERGSERNPTSPFERHPTSPGLGGASASAAASAGGAHAAPGDAQRSAPTTPLGSGLEHAGSGLGSYGMPSPSAAALVAMEKVSAGVMDDGQGHGGSGTQMRLSQQQQQQQQAGGSVLLSRGLSTEQQALSHIDRLLSQSSGCLTPLASHANSRRALVSSNSGFGHSGPGGAFNTTNNSVASTSTAAAGGSGMAGPSKVTAVRQPMLTPIPAPMPVEAAEAVLATANEWQFDAFALAEATRGHPLSCLAYYLIHRAGLMTRFGLNPTSLSRYLRTIESGYASNPYHCATHAADVLQSVHVILHRGGLVGGYVDPLRLFAMYLAAVLHDYQHPGRTNDFLIATHHQLALTYNDRAPLENHHASSGLSLLHSSDARWANKITPSEYMSLRALVVDLILATDMKQHFSIVSHFAALYNTNPGAGMAVLTAWQQQQQQAANASMSGSQLPSLSVLQAMAQSTGGQGRAEGKDGTVVINMGAPSDAAPRVPPTTRNASSGNLMRGASGSSTAAAAAVHQKPPVVPNRRFSMDVRQLARPWAKEAPALPVAALGSNDSKSGGGVGGMLARTSRALPFGKRRCSVDINNHSLVAGSGAAGGGGHGPGMDGVTPGGLATILASTGGNSNEGASGSSANGDAAGAGAAAASGAEATSANLPAVLQPKGDAERLVALQMVLKAADLGHTAAEIAVHKKWLAGLEEEFFRQGDDERARGLPISPLFDRQKQGASKSQTGFYEFVVNPLFQHLAAAFPAVAPLLGHVITNYDYWKSAAPPPAPSAPAAPVAAPAAPVAAPAAPVAAPAAPAAAAAAGSSEDQPAAAAAGATATAPTPGSGISATRLRPHRIF